MFDDDDDDSGDSSSALTALLNTAAQIGTTALVANSSVPLAVQGPNGIITNSPSIVSSSSAMIWIILAIVAVVGIVLIVR